MKWDALKQTTKQVGEPVALSLITISEAGILNSALEEAVREETDEQPFKRLFKVPVAAGKKVDDDDDDLDDEDGLDDDFELDEDFEDFDMPKPKKSTDKKSDDDDDDDFKIDDDFNFDDLDDFDDDEEEDDF